MIFCPPIVEVMDGIMDGLYTLPPSVEVMDGVLASSEGKISLSDELELFHEYCVDNGLDKCFDLVPSEDFSDLQEYHF